MTPVIKSTPNTNMNDMMGGYYMSWLLTLRLKTSINVGEGAISWLHLQLLLWQTCQSVLACEHTNELEWSIHWHFHEPGHGNIGRGASVRKPTVWLCARTRLTDHSHSHTLCKSPVKPPGQWDKSHQGGLSMVKIVLTSHFHKKVRATIGLVPTSQLPWWCYIEIERTIWERNGLIETPTLRGIVARWLREKA